MAEKILILADSFMVALAAIFPALGRWLRRTDEAIKTREEFLEGERSR